MPTITSAGTFTKATTGFGSLAKSSGPRNLLFAGSSVGTSCLVQYTDDTGTLRTFENGTITLPASLEIKAFVDVSVVVAGSPNFNLTITD